MKVDCGDDQHEDRDDEKSPSSLTSREHFASASSCHRFGVRCLTMNERVVVAVVIMFRGKQEWYMCTFSSGDAAAGAGSCSHLQNFVFLADPFKVSMPFLPRIPRFPRAILPHLAFWDAFRMSTISGSSISW